MQFKVHVHQKLYSSHKLVGIVKSDLDVGRREKKMKIDRIKEHGFTLLSLSLSLSLCLSRA